MNKPHLHSYCVQLLETRLHELKTQINEVQESANNNTKSSAGDKYETGRAMAHLELEKLQQSHQHNKQLLQLLKQYDKSSTQLEAGALVETQKGWFYISVALGKMKFEGKDLFCLSPSSPLAQCFIQNPQAKKHHFNQQVFEILSIQ